MAMEWLSTFYCHELLHIFESFFFQVWKLLSFFYCFQSQWPENLHYGLKISFCIVFNCIEIVFNVLISRVLEKFLMKFAYFQLLNFVFHFFLCQWLIKWVCLVEWVCLIGCSVAFRVKS